MAVEPSDSIMFPGLTLLAHRDASFYRPLGPAPALSVVVIDPGGAVETLAFNRADHSAALKKLAPRHHEAFELLAIGLARGDRHAVAEAGTMSVLADQALLPNPLLEPALALARRGGWPWDRACTQRYVGRRCLRAGVRQCDIATGTTALPRMHHPPSPLPVKGLNAKSPHRTVR